MQNENGVLAVQEDFGNTLVDKYAPVWDKKYRSKGESIWVFQRRTLSSACQVATTLHDMDFGKASTSSFTWSVKLRSANPSLRPSALR